MECHKGFERCSLCPFSPVTMLRYIIMWKMTGGYILSFLALKLEKNRSFPRIWYNVDGSEIPNNHRLDV